MACRSVFILLTATAAALFLQLVCGVSSAPTDGNDDVIGDQVHVTTTRNKRDVDQITAEKIEKLYKKIFRECPRDFRFVSSVNGCYKAMTDRKVDWNSAADMCRQQNSEAHPLIINDAAEQQAFTTMLEHHYNEISLRSCTPGSWAGPSFWTAGQRVVTTSETPFVWKVFSEDGRTTKTSHMAYTNWHQGEPSSSAESCLSVHKEWNYQWNDAVCSHQVACVICEIDL